MRFMQTMLRFSFVVVLSFGCRTLTNGELSQSSQSLSGDTPDLFGSFECAQGDFTPFMFSRLNFSPPISLVQFPFGPGGLIKLRAPSTDVGFVVRLDVCTTDTLSLKRVLFRTRSSPEIMEFVTTSDAIVEGLEEVVFNKDYSHLKIRLPRKDIADPKEVLMIDGWTSPTTGFATATRQIDLESNVSINSAHVLAGTIEFGDPLSDKRCPVGQVFNQSSFRLGNATLETEQCENFGAGHTVKYDVIAVTVTDSDSDLPESDKHAVLLQGEALKARVSFESHHHNACDAMAIKMPHATYIVAAGFREEGCTSVISGAPGLITDPDKIGLAAYRIRYDGGDWQEGVLPCFHFLYGCEAKIQENLSTILPGEYQWRNSYRGWDSFALATDEVRLVIDTKLGTQDANFDRIGFVPFTRFNHVIATDRDKETIELSDFNNEFSGAQTGGYYCRQVSSLVDSLTSFPVAATELFEKFSVATENTGGCPSLKVNKPPLFRGVTKVGPILRVTCYVSSS